MGSKTPIAVIADVHFHERSAYAKHTQEFGALNSRLGHIYKAVCFAIHSASKQGAKTLIVAGDLGHSRRKLSIPVLDVIGRTFSVAKQHGLKVYLLEGNHDRSEDGSACTLDALDADQVITGNPCVVQVDGWNVGFIPWTDNSAVVEKAISMNADFYVGHFGVDSAKVGPSGYEIRGHITPSTLRKTKKPVLLGHYHGHQYIEGTSAMYVGSPIQHDWGEAGQKKYYALVTSTGVRMVEIPGPKFVRVKDSDIQAAIRDKRLRECDWIRVVSSSPEMTDRARAIVKNAGMSDEFVDFTSEDSKEEAPPRLAISGLSIRDQLAEYVNAFGSELLNEYSVEDIVQFGMDMLEPHHD